jgi:ParB-like nuclease domain
MKVSGAERIHVKLKDLHPNPYRRMATYPMRREKVAALMQSIKTNEWWENIEVRRAPDGKGYQIAYGHHRLEALRMLYSGNDEVRVMLRELSAEQMLRRMADENLDFAGNDALVDIETVGAVIEAYLTGDVELEKPTDSRSDLIIEVDRAAVHFRYSPLTVGKFLGWLREDGRSSERVRVAFAAWHAIQDGYVKLADFHALRKRQDLVSRDAVDALVAAGRSQWIDFAARAREAEEKGKRERAEALREEGREKARAQAAKAREQYVTKQRSAEAIRRDPAITRQRREVTVKEWIRQIRRDVRAVGQSDQFAEIIRRLLAIVRDGDVEPDELISLADEIVAARDQLAARWTQYDKDLRDVIRRRNITPVRRALAAKRS